MLESWKQYAFDPPRACGAPLAIGILRTEPEDFLVEEELGFKPAGVGQHILLKVRKRNANTRWVARELAKTGACRPADVGYAGLKDRRAVAVQWFSVPRCGQPLESWVNLQSPEFGVLEAHAHTRKLPRGALAANRFAIRIRGTAVDEAALSQRAEWIARCGVPNYFGPQRFGRDGANLQRITASVSALRAPERSFVLSAARSLIFNAVLAERVQDLSWNRLESGDLANLDSRGSIFPVGEEDSTLRERSERLDIHPTGPMWGRGAPQSGGRVREVEERIAAGLSPAPELVSAAGMTQERRSLRVSVRDLQWAREGSDVIFQFRLARGSFATTVLRELFHFDTAQGDEDTGS